MANQIALSRERRRPCATGPPDHEVSWKAPWQKERRRLEKAQRRAEPQKGPTNCAGGDVQKVISRFELSHAD